MSMERKLVVLFEWGLIVKKMFVLKFVWLHFRYNYFLLYKFHNISFVKKYCFLHQDYIFLIYVYVFDLLPKDLMSKSKGTSKSCKN